MSDSENKLQLGLESWKKGHFHADAGRFREAANEFRKAARLGNPMAQDALATVLDDNASPKRPLEAVKWYKRAVRAGYSTSALNLGVHYRNLGKLRWAKYWFSIAERMGDEDARLEIQNLAQQHTKVRVGKGAKERISKKKN